MTDEDTKANYAGVFDAEVGFGERPALVLVDFVNAYTDPEAPLYAPAVVDAVRATKPLLEDARRRRIPIFHTRVEYDPSGLDGGVFVRKVPVLREMVAGAHIARIVEDLTPREGEPVVVKQYASAFFGTALASAMTALGVDTVILVGCSTSGCVRATAVDAMQHGFRLVVPRECVGDRAEGPHEANLFDIHAKYGDVLPRKQVLEALARVAPAR